MEVFNEHINDRWLSLLVLRFLKAGYIDFKNLNNSKLTSDEGEPQSALLSPLLCNILLHKFDQNILKVIKGFPRHDKKKNSTSEGYKMSRRSTNIPWEEVYKETKSFVYPVVSKKLVDKTLRTIRI